MKNHRFGINLQLSTTIMFRRFHQLFSEKLQKLSTSFREKPLKIIHFAETCNFRTNCHVSYHKTVNLLEIWRILPPTLPQCFGLRFREVREIKIKCQEMKPKSIKFGQSLDFLTAGQGNKDSSSEIASTFDIS